MSKTVVGIDVGGTFTDIAVFSEGKLQIHKLSSTPEDPSKAVNQGISDAGITSAEFVHGSTVATNALLESKGSRTALVTTMGFEDVLEIGRQNRSDLYDIGLDKPPALVPWELRFGISERISHTGEILEDLNKDSIDTLVQLIRESEVEAVAICLLFSFMNPIHEQMIYEALNSLPNPPFISISSKTLPEFREYERTATIVINSYVGPLMSRYLEKLERSLGSGLRIMQSSGGSITTRIAGEEPVRTVLSGPAGGVVGAFHIASEAGYTNIITLDMGGTSTDVSLCPGEIKQTSSSNLSGYPIGVPMIEIHTVGAGGGSIANMDIGGALAVGPQSAGANPGPACYGTGESVTVTDANLLLGRIQPEQFLGGRMDLNVKRANHMVSDLANLLQTNVQPAAMGILRVVNSHMERAIRSISLERGYDPREFTLVPFGGAGPLHSCELAEELGITRVLVPRFPGILSAFGVAIADIVKDYSRTIMAKGSDVDTLLLTEEFSGMESLAKRELITEGLSEQDMVFQRFLDVRYIGQSFELTIDCPNLYSSKDLLGTISNRFQKVHRRRFGYADRNEPIEIVNLRIKLKVNVEKPFNIPHQFSSKSPDNALIGSQPVSFREGPIETKLFNREDLKTGNEIQGPAIIIQMDSTTVIPPHWTGTVDPYHNLIVEFNT